MVPWDVPSVYPLDYPNIFFLGDILRLIIMCALMVTLGCYRLGYPNRLGLFLRATPTLSSWVPSGYSLGTPEGRKHL